MNQWRHILWPLAWLVLIVFYIGAALAFFGYTEDDAGITFRYGANLFDGHGLVYNPGEHVEGYSNFGHVVLVGLLYKLIGLFGLSRPWVVVAVKVVNLLAGIAAMVFCYRFARDCLHRDRVMAFFAAALLAANGAFLVHTASPLETTTYTLLLVMLMYYQARYLADRPFGGFPWAYLVVGFLFSVWRIDAPVLVAGFFLAFLIGCRFRLSRRDWALAATWLALFGAYTAFRFWYFGDIANNPYYAKIRPSLAASFGTPYTSDFWFLLGGNSVVAIVILLGVIIADPRAYVLPAVLIVTQWLYIAVVGGDWMPAFRFWVPLVPCLAVTLVAAVSLPLPSRRSPLAQTIRALLLVTVVCWWAAAGVVMYEFRGGRPYQFFRDTGTTALEKLNPSYRASQWINAHVRSDALMVLGEGGFLPFLTGLPTIETFGLCDRELARVEGNRSRLGLKIRWDRIDDGMRYILSRNPDLLVVGPDPYWTDTQSRLFDRYIFVTNLPSALFLYEREGAAAVR